jgi:hypothetical protein
VGAEKSFGFDVNRIGAAKAKDKAERSITIIALADARPLAQAATIAVRRRRQRTNFGARVAALLRAGARGSPTPASGVEQSGQRVVT